MSGKFSTKNLEKEKEKITGKILLLQSTPTESELLKIPLSDIGFTVYTTTDADEALQIYLDERPDLIVVSAFLPKGNTLDFCRKIRSKHHDEKIPIIMTSAVSSGTIFIEARAKWGVNDVIILPAKFSRILHLILYHLGFESTRPSVLDEEEETAALADINLAPVPAPKKKGLPTFGDLKDIPLEKILRMMLANHRTGLLKIGAGENEITLHILRGSLVFANSGYIAGLSLGDVVQEENLVPRDYLPAIRKRMLDEKRLLGHLLLKAGLIEQEVLGKALVRQILKKAAHPFKWSEGPYLYLNQTVQPPSDVGIDIYLGRLILDGVRNAIDPNLFERRSGNLAGAFLKNQYTAAVDMRKLDLTGNEKRFLHSMDGTRTLGQLTHTSKLSSEEIVRLVAGLIALRMVRRMDEESGPGD